MNRDADLYARTIAWRETMRTPCFFLLDAHIVFVLPLFVFHIRWWTFAVLVFAVLAFAALRGFQYRPSSALRLLRSTLAGQVRPAQSVGSGRSAVDFGFEYRIQARQRLKG